MLQAPGVQSGLVHAEEDGSPCRPPEARDQGVVGVQDHRAFLRQVSEGRGDDLARVGKLPVAVELVPEKVEDRKDLDPRLRGHPWHARLVHLEEPHLGGGRTGKSRVRDDGRGYACDQVRPRRVVHGPYTGRLQDFGHHPGRCRLAVSASKGRRTKGKPLRELGQDLRVHPARHDPGHRGTSAGLQRAASKPGRPGGQYRGEETEVYRTHGADYIRSGGPLCVERFREIRVRLPANIISTGLIQPRTS